MTNSDTLLFLSCLYGLLECFYNYKWQKKSLVFISMLHNCHSNINLLHFFFFISNLTAFFSYKSENTECNLKQLSKKLKFY